MYIRPLTAVSRYARKNRLFEMRADLHNRRVTITFRKLGHDGRTIVKTFARRDDAREYVETVEARRDMLGYVKVSR